jgi:hypothetical protein
MQASAAMWWLDVANPVDLKGYSSIHAGHSAMHCSEPTKKHRSSTGFTREFATVDGSAAPTGI